MQKWICDRFQIGVLIIVNGKFDGVIPEIRFAAGLDSFSRKVVLGGSCWEKRYSRRPLYKKRLLKKLSALGVDSLFEGNNFWDLP